MGDVDELEMALRMHQVQFERANRLEAEVEQLRREDARLRALIAGQLAAETRAMGLHVDERPPPAVAITPAELAVDLADAAIEDGYDGA